MSSAQGAAAARAAEERSRAASQSQQAHLNADGFDSNSFKLKVKRVLDKEISANASAHVTSRCLRLMHALLHNVEQHPQEAKYRSFKSAQPKIHKEVLCVTGAKELLHLAGWNTRVRDFTEEWAFDEKFRPGTAAWSRLKLVVQCLDEHARSLEETAERIKGMQEREAQAEKSRKALAMSQAEEDRERVRRRVERERIAREAKAKSELAQREAGPIQSPSVSTAQGQSPRTGSAKPIEEEATDAEDDYIEVPGHFSELSGGQRLGAKDGA